MAYVFGKRTNAYSNPSLMYPGTDIPTGGDSANNAMVISLNGKRFSELGDESSPCFDEIHTTTIKTTTEATTTNSGTSTCQDCKFPFKMKIGMKTTIHNKCTVIDGARKPWCSTKVDELGYHIQGEENRVTCEDPECPILSTAGKEMEVAPENEIGSCCK